MTKIIFYSILSLLILSCNAIKPKKVNTRETPVNAQERARKNVEEGGGASLGDLIGRRGSNTFEFSTSNPMWRASLETLDFLPLATVDYSGGIIITDWYSENQNPNESVKITIRFLTNEVRSDALDIKVFNRKCLDNLLNCKFTQTDGILVTELKKEISIQKNWEIISLR